MKKEEIVSKENNIGQDVKILTVKLDEHTFVTIRKLSSFDKWKERYPKARLIQ